MYDNISEFLREVVDTKKSYKYTSGNDYEVIKYKETNDKGVNVYDFAQYEYNYPEEPYFKDVMYEHDLMAFFSNQLTKRDWRNAIKIGC